MLRSAAVIVVSNPNAFAQGWSPPIRGRLVRIDYLKTDYATGVDFALKWESTGETIWAETDVDADAHHRIGLPISDSAGATISGPPDAALYDSPYSDGDRIQIDVTDAGNGKVGTFKFLWDEPAGVPTFSQASFRGAS